MRSIHKYNSYPWPINFQLATYYVLVISISVFFNLNGVFVFDFQFFVQFLVLVEHRATEKKMKGLVDSSSGVW